MGCLGQSCSRTTWLIPVAVYSIKTLVLSDVQMINVNHSCRFLNKFLAAIHLKENHKKKVTLEHYHHGSVIPAVTRSNLCDDWHFNGKVFQAFLGANFPKQARTSTHAYYIHIVKGKRTSLRYNSPEKCFSVLLLSCLLINLFSYVHLYPQEVPWKIYTIPFITV
jgi:hypothetical protein